MRAACATPLLKSVELASQRKILYPFMTYRYFGLECSLQSLLLIPGLALACEQWRSRCTTEGVMEDVYDGNIWKEFQVYGDRPFLSNPFAFGLMMNIDWFIPYKHLTYSVGVVYLTIMNLPRNLRYKRENILLVGIIPGPHEPSHDINSYLDPLVKELLLFWDGIHLDVHGCHKALVQCALLCLACDLPVGRKAGGFLGHSAHLGCSRCLKRFVGRVGEMDYSGFERESWPPRTGKRHREDAETLLACNTKKELEGSESKLGCRYSVLLRLPYFDAPRMLIVDPMHNLFLGSGKHLLKAVWLEREVIRRFRRLWC